MILSTNITEIQYCFQLSVDNFIAVERKDSEVDHSLHDRLEALDSVVKIEYNGMFGPFIFVSINPENPQRTLVKIADVIEQYVNTIP
jgi:hypothetical protein